MRRFPSVVILALIIALTAGVRETTTQTSAAQYGITDLGSIGGEWSVVRGMAPDAFPFVAGYGATASGAEHAFYGNTRGLNDIGTLGGARSEARDFNGGVVGFSQVASGASHAFLYNFPVMVDLGTLGGTESYATALNALGIVVGASALAGDASTRGFVYQDGVMTQLAATLGGPNTVAMDINNTGHIVGYADLPGGQSHHAFLYAAGVTTDLGSWGPASEAFAINDSGVIVGRSRLASGTNQHAFRYQNGVRQDLGTLGGASSEALAVNRDGVIVGWADSPAGQPRAFVWRNGSMIDLNTLIPPGTGWVLETAVAIGDFGAIAGNGSFKGQRRPFLLTPPIDLRANLKLHPHQLETNIPNPHEAGRVLTLGVTVSQQGPHAATGVTVVNTLSGPVEILGWPLADCVREPPLQLVCHLPPVEFDGSLLFTVRATDAGVISHSATVTADQPDPSPSNNHATETNTAVNLAAFTIGPTMVLGGQLALGRVTLTSPTPTGGAPMTFSNSRPDIVSIPTPFDVLPWINGGLWREFYLTTRPVSAPVTVQISAKYGLETFTVPLTVMPAGSQWPLRGTAWNIPGTIQAEDFDEGGEGSAYHDTSRGNETATYRTTDVDLEPTSDTGGGSNVGWTNAGEWLEYTVDVAASGAYALEARVASLLAGGTFHVEVDGVDKTGAMVVPQTGGWQAWTTISRPVTLPAGMHIVRVSFDVNGPGGTIGNLNFLRFTALTTGSTPFGGTPAPVPGIVQAENFDEGGEGVAFHDTTTENSGGQHRTTAVDIERTTDAGGGYNVGWMTAGEWLNYTVAVQQGGTYRLSARVAANGAGGRFHIEIDGVNVTGALTIPNTGSWQAWTDVAATATIAGGVHRMRFVADVAGPTGVFGNLNSITVTATSVPAAEVVLYAADLTLNGSWLRTADPSGAGGQKALTPDAGWSTASAPLASPIDYVEATFDAPAATPFAIWLRLRATGETKFSESVWVQFSDARVNTTTAFPIGSTSGLLVNLETCRDCGVSGWGWQNGAYWLTQPARVTFATSGRHTIRVQVREDGAQIDQIVLSPSRYLSTAPGAARNDATIVPR